MSCAAGRCGTLGRAGLLLAVMAAAACAPLPPRPPTLSADLAVGAVPFHPQREHECGPAALAMLLGARGVAVAPAALVPLLIVPERAGTLQPELLAQARRRGFIAQAIAPDLAALGAELAAGRPVLVLKNDGLAWYPVWHYAVVIGYDASRDALLLHSGVSARLAQPRRSFESTWARSGRWGFVLLAPGELPVGTDAPAHARALAAFDASGGTPAQARVAWQAARRQWPTRWEFAFGLGNRLAADGETAAAIEALATATTLDPAQAAAWNNLANAYLDAGRWDEALAAAQAAAARSSAPEVIATLREARCRREPCAAE